MANWLSVLGLVLTLIGAGVLVRVEITGIFASIKQRHDIPPGPRYQKIVIWLARCFGSRDPLAIMSFGIPTVATKLLDFLFIFLGTLLQICGAL